MSAASNGHKDTVHVLVKECGADVHAADNAGSTAVMLAAHNGHKDTVHVLVKDCGADVNAATILVKDCGADVNVATKAGPL